MDTPAPRAPLDQSAITKKISQYWRVKVVEVTGSTQDDVAVSATIGDAIPGDLIAAEFQRNGRGRLDRTFEAASGSALMFSFYITPTQDKNYWSFLPLLTGLALHDALKILDSNTRCDVKWPNDLLIGDKKTAGIIAQSSGDGVVIGVGINVGMQQSELPVPTATSLALENFKILDRNEILASFINTFEKLFTQWDAGEDFTEEYKAVSSTVGRDVEVQMPGDKVIYCHVADINHHGALIASDGTAITAGDVIHLR